MKKTADILEINKKQKEFYNNARARQNVFTRLWANLRNGVLNGIRKKITIKDQIYALHKEWFGDLSDKKVLDLGCYTGNHWSMYLAENSKQYLGIDLSDVAIKGLKERLQPFPNAKAEAIDFLSTDFGERDYDLIYAYSVLHHFGNTSILIDRLNEKLATNGTIISYDPLETSLPIKILRTVYRPFQSDAAWEWPFTKKVFYQLQKAFTIIDRRGILGKSKWFALINILPISEEKKRKIGQDWHNKDWEQSRTSDKILFNCMHLTMLMKKK